MSSNRARELLAEAMAAELQPDDARPQMVRELCSDNLSWFQRAALRAIEKALSTPTPPPAVRDEVTQEDRLAAVPFAIGHEKTEGGYTFSYGHLIRSGELDGHPLVQAFARHRRASALGENDRRDDWRCVNCKRVVRSETEPERCGECGGRTFAHMDRRASALGGVGEAERAVKEAAEPWADYHGDLPDYDHPMRPVYESGIQYAVELLAKMLGVEDYTPCDGTEDFDGDLGGTLMNIVLEAMPKDEHGDPIYPRDLAATLETRAAEIEGLREALGRIARNEVEVFDTDLARHVIVSMDAEELAEIASEALLTTAPPAPGMGEG